MRSEPLERMPSRAIPWPGRETFNAAFKSVRVDGRDVTVSNGDVFIEADSHVELVIDDYEPGDTPLHGHVEVNGVTVSEPGMGRN